MDKGTLIYIGGFELPDRNAAAHRVLGNAKILKELGYNVVFIDIDKNVHFNDNEKYVKKEIDEFECWSLMYPQSKKQWINYLTNIDSFKSILDKYKDTVGVIAYNYQAIAFLKIIKYCKNKNIKIYGDCTEWYDPKGNNLIFYIIKSLDSWLRMNVVHTKTDGMIVISDYLYNFYIKKGVDRVSKIPPVIDKLDKKWNKLNNVELDNINFVYAGTPGKHKDKINYILEALSKVGKENFKIKIIGIDKKTYLNYYPKHEYLIEQLKNKIEFMGRLNHLSTINYVKNSDFLIFTRDINRVTLAGFPTKFVESISCGVPVITNISSDLNEYLINGENGFILEEDNIENNLKEILETDCKKLKQMKYNVIRDTFDYRKFKLELGKIFSIQNT